MVSPVLPGLNLWKLRLRQDRRVPTCTLLGCVRASALGNQGPAPDCQVLVPYRRQEARSPERLRPETQDRTQGAVEGLQTRACRPLSFHKMVPRLIPRQHTEDITLRTSLGNHQPESGVRALTLSGCPKKEAACSLLSQG